MKVVQLISLTQEENTQPLCKSFYNSKSGNKAQGYKEKRGYG